MGGGAGSRGWGEEVPGLKDGDEGVKDDVTRIRSKGRKKGLGGGLEKEGASCG